MVAGSRFMRNPAREIMMKRAGKSVVARDGVFAQNESSNATGSALLF